MNLSLSTRVAEEPGRKDRALLSLGEIAGLAVGAGYSALSMRASQVSVADGADPVDQAKRDIDQHGLKVSMVTGDVDLAANNNRAQMALQHITPYLDLADALDCDLVRVMMKAESDIPHARRAADEAAERGIRLAHQTHTCTLFETVTGAIRVLRAVNRPNFGVTFEPANLMLAGQPCGRTAIRALAPWIFNVYFQNHRLNSDADHVQETWSKGPVPFDLIPLDATDGIDFQEVVDTLDEIDYDGYVTVHQNVADGLDIATGVKSFADYLRSIAYFE